MYDVLKHNDACIWCSNLLVTFYIFIFGSQIIWYMYVVLKNTPPPPPTHVEFYYLYPPETIIIRVSQRIWFITTFHLSYIHLCMCKKWWFSFGNKIHNTLRLQFIILLSDLEIILRQRFSTDIWCKWLLVHKLLTLRLLQGYLKLKTSRFLILQIYN